MHRFEGLCKKPQEQAAQFLDAALDGDAKAQYIVTGLITEFPEQLFAEPVNEVTMRQLMQRALHGDHVVQQQVAALLQQIVALLQPLVRPEIPQTFKVLGNTSSNLLPDVERTFPSWDEALAFAQTLAGQFPDGHIMIHPPRTGHALHYRVLSSGEVEEIDPKGQREQSFVSTAQSQVSQMTPSMYQWLRDQSFMSTAQSQLSPMAPSMYQQAGRGFFLFDEREHPLEAPPPYDIGYWGLSEITKLPISKAEAESIRASVATYLVESEFIAVILHTDLSISVHQLKLDCGH